MNALDSHISGISNRTILIIDDDPLVMQIARAIIEKIGYHVLEAATGEEAINITASHAGAIDLVILDLILPDIKAMDLFLRLREYRPNMKVLITSGYNQDKIIEEILISGAVGFIQKPYSFKLLESKLKELLGSHHEP